MRKSSRLKNFILAPALVALTGCALLVVYSSLNFFKKTNTPTTTHQLMPGIPGSNQNHNSRLEPEVPDRNEVIPPYSKYAGLVVDLQLEQGDANYPFHAVALERLIEKGIPIVVTEMAGCGYTAPSLMDIIRKSDKYVVIPKTCANSFKRTPLNKTLTDWGTVRLVIMGMEESDCMYRTVYGALDNGYGVELAQDLVIAESRSKHPLVSEIFNLTNYKQNWKNLPVMVGKPSESFDFEKRRREQSKRFDPKKFRPLWPETPEQDRFFRESGFAAWRKMVVEQYNSN